MPLFRFKNIIAALFVVTGMGILGYTLYSKSDNSFDTRGHLDPQNHVINPELISNYLDKEKQHEALALFVVADEFCSSCINEIVEYTEAVSKYIKSPIYDINTQRHAVIVGDDSTDYKQVNHLIGFPFPSSLLKKDRPLAQKFKQWKQDISGMNQVVLIDLNRDEVVGRIGIFTSSTTPVFKKNLVQQAFYELEK